MHLKCFTCSASTLYKRRGSCSTKRMILSFLHFSQLTSPPPPPLLSFPPPPPLLSISPFSPPSLPLLPGPLSSPPFLPFPPHPSLPSSARPQSSSGSSSLGRCSSCRLIRLGGDRVRSEAPKAGDSGRCAGVVPKKSSSKEDKGYKCKEKVKQVSKSV